MHEAGRGVLLSLADFGLTGSVEFGFKYRLKIEIQLVLETDPDTEQGVYGDTSDTIASAQRQFTVALIRQNRLLHGDVSQLRFEYLNEK